MLRQNQCSRLEGGGGGGGGVSGQKPEKFGNLTRQNKW